MPVVVEVSGVEFVPIGLPQPVSWSIRLVSGPGRVTVKLADLGSSMIAVDNQRQAVVQRNLEPDELWTVTAVIDPAAGSGAFAFRVETADFTEAVLLEWSAVDVNGVTTQTKIIYLSGQPPPPTAAANSGDSGAGSGAQTTYESALHGLSFDYPTNWFVIEEADAILVAQRVAALNQPDGNLLLTFEAAVEGDDPAVRLAEMLSGGLTAGESLMVGEQTAVVIDNAPGSMAEIEVHQEGQDERDIFKGVVFVIIYGDAAVIAVSLSSDDAELEQFIQIIRSIKFG